MRSMNNFNFYSSPSVAQALLSALPMKIICFFCAFALTSCITTVTEPLDIAFVEQLVVRGTLRSGEVIDNISLTKSLPTLAEYSDSAAAVSDATGTITVNNEAHPLRLQLPATPDVASRTLYGTSAQGMTGLRAETGKTYSLRFQRGSKVITATTRIPTRPNVQEVRIVPQTVLTVTTATPIPGAQPVTTFRTDTVFAAEVVLLAEPRTVYRVAMQLVDSVRSSGQIVELTGFYEGGAIFHTEATASQKTLRSGALPLQTQALMKRLLAQGVNVRYRLVVVAFDEPYYAYLLTRSRGQQASNIFGGTSNENVTWNVQGDGIGMFIGTAERELMMPAP